MSGRSFHVYLTSNARTTRENNETGSFTVDLHESIDLGGCENDWRVGVREAFIPSDWTNISDCHFQVVHKDGEPKADRKLVKLEYEENARALVYSASGIEPDSEVLRERNKHVKDEDETMEEEAAERDVRMAWPPLGFHTETKRVDDGRYSLKSFIKAFNKQTKNSKEDKGANHFNTTIGYDDSERDVNVNVEPNEAIWFTNDRIRKMLGFADKNHGLIVNETGHRLKVDLPFQPKFNANVECGYIYSDIVQTTTMSDTSVPILRILKLEYSEDKLMNMIYHRFDPPLFVKVGPRFISSIQIEIRDSLGKIIQFNSGDIILVLEFRLFT